MRPQQWNSEVLIASFIRRTDPIERRRRAKAQLNSPTPGSGG